METFYKNLFETSAMAVTQEDHGLIPAYRSAVEKLQARSPHLLETNSQQVVSVSRGRTSTDFVMEDLTVTVCGTLDDPDERQGDWATSQEEFDRDLENRRHPTHCRRTVTSVVRVASSRCAITAMASTLFHRPHRLALFICSLRCAQRPPSHHYHSQHRHASQRGNQLVSLSQAVPPRSTATPPCIHPTKADQ